jgi:hypothetical protein
MKIIIIKFSSIFLIALLVEWWLMHYSPLNLPENIPNTPIRISGLLLMGIILTVLIATQKKILKLNPSTSILKLTLISSLICFISEAIFQLLRQFIIYADNISDRIYYFALGTIGMTIFAAIFSFFVAFQIKTKKTGQLILMIIAFIFIINVFYYFFPSLTG